MKARDLRLMAVALGGLALVVAARAGESTSQQDALTVDDASGSAVVASGGSGGADGGDSLLPGVDGELAGLAGAEAIRLVDFADVDQSGETCSEGLEGETPSVIPVEQGESAVLDPDRVVQLEVDGAEAYGDLDGDGGDEALVRAVCAFGANGTQETVQVWDLDSGRPEASASLAEPPASIESRFAPTVNDVAIQDGSVVVTWDSYSDGAAHCCPDEQTRFTYELVGHELLLIGAPSSD